MIEVRLRYEVDGQAVQPGELDDDYELAEMLEHTGEQARRQVSDQLAAVRCPEHDQPPRAQVSIVYSSETGQIEQSYHLDTCCQTLLLRAVQALNRR